MTLVAYTSIPIQESKEPLVDLSSFPFMLEPRYHQAGLSSTPQIFLRETVAKKLVAIQENSEVRFKIWDGYRSRAVQNAIYQKFWRELAEAHPDWDEEILKLEVGKFVSPTDQMDRIPPHATGGAVDLSLVDANGRELDMGTDFDHFGPEASPFYSGNEPARENRQLLREAMLSEGFTPDQDEWWHFDYGNQIWALKAGEKAAIYGEL